MCGIVGYIGNFNALKQAIDGLKKLEYRGYDSSGVAYKKNNEIIICKEKGRIYNLEKILNDFKSDLAIGHTRWATHGIASKINAHPHVSMNNRFVVVHNGIIENYLTLKYEYLKDYTFISETDTEVIANLIDFFSKTLDIKEAIKKTMSVMEGSYACLILDRKNPNMIYFIKDKSPLLIGRSKNGTSFSSDISGLIGYADSYISVEDKSFGIAFKDSLFISDIIGISKPLNYKKISVKKEEIDKQEYNHFMLKEIYEQPSIIRKLINNYFNYEEVNISKKIIHLIKESDKLYLVGCGSSMYASYYAKYYFEKICDKHAEVFSASELVYSNILITKRPFFIFYSQSGETADLIAVIKKYKKYNYPTLTITNTAESTMIRLSDFHLNIYAGKEIAVASTKSYTAMIALSAILARAVSKNKTNLKNNLKAISLAMDKVLENKKICERLASKIVEANEVFYIGRGIDYWMCLEASLKLKEVAYIHTEAFSSGELKHGPIALIDNKTIVIAIITQEGTNRIIRNNLIETSSRGAKTFVISSKSLSMTNDDIIIPNVAHYLSGLVSALVIQLIAYYAAVIKQYDVDKPKNLAKSVTVE